MFSRFLVTERSWTQKVLSTPNLVLLLPVRQWGLNFLQCTHSSWPRPQAPDDAIFIEPWRMSSVFRASREDILISVDKGCFLNALYCLKLWVRRAGNGKRIILGIFLILFKQTEDWRVFLAGSLCLTSVTEYRIIMGGECVFLNWVCFLEINVDLRLLTSQSKSFQVVWGCEGLGGKP